MPKIAIDIALIPDRKIIQELVKINNNSVKIYSKLNTNNNLPHITLAMGVIDKKYLTEVILIIKKILKKYSKFECNMINQNSQEFEKDKFMLRIELEKNKKMIKLHKEIMENLKSYFSYDLNPEMFYDKKINNITLNWIKNYEKKQGHPELFNPHINLKCTPTQIKLGFKNIKSSTIVVCQLGNYCTCRTVLADFKLNQRSQRHYQ